MLYGQTMNAPTPCVILNEPQLAENIGAVARVMANFGLSDLRLVRPRDGWPQDRAWASASGANWPLDGARVFDTLAAAIADLRLVLATTARPREAMLPVITPREAAARLDDAGAQGWPSGLLFGGERAGLETADIALCGAIVTIPVDPRFHSLNLAQAVALTAYEYRLTQADGPPPKFTAAPPPAEQAALQGFYDQLEGELDAAGFFHPPEKRASMVRNLRVAFGRAALSDQEVRTLRGVVTALSKGRGRVLAKLAAAKARLKAESADRTAGAKDPEP
jgi:tRNA/rRNA methyltransferase